MALAMIRKTDMKYTNGFFASGKDIILFLDRHGRLLDVWSPETQKQPAETKKLHGRTLQEIFPLEIANLHFTHLSRVIETGSNQVYGYEMETASGEPAIWEVQMVTVPGSHPSICCILKNVTKEQQIIQVVEQKERQVKTMMKFTLEREDRMIQLKQEINRLRKSLGKQPKYMSYTVHPQSAKE
jgi:cysteine sulfinate desulfinase/cysteine desulfurase-like protein